MRVLITGARGASGRFLTDLLSRDPETEIYETDLSDESSPRYFAIDLSDFSSTYRLITEIRPSQIYNLAGTFTNDYETDYGSNVLAPKNILDSLLKAGISCRVLLIGSAAEYGHVAKEENPVKETQPLNPVTIYGLTKTYQTQLMKYFCTVHGMDIVMARVFNLYGAGFSNRLFIGRIFRQIEEYKSGRRQAIVVGNLGAKRDYIDIREAVADYRLIINRGAKGDVYNVGCGRSVRISELLSSILAKHGLDMSVVQCNSMTNDVRPDVADIYADVSKLSHLRSSSPYTDQPVPLNPT